jgi:hypothetical protein
VGLDPQFPPQPVAKRIKSLQIVDFWAFLFAAGIKLFIHTQSVGE